MSTPVSSFAVTRPWWARRWEVVYFDATGPVVAARAFTEAGAWRALSGWECSTAGRGHLIEMSVRRRP